MTTPRDQFDQADEANQPLPAPQSDAERVRRAADGELDAAHELEGDPRIASERDLRSAVGRVMSDVAVPAGLAERVAAAIDRETLAAQPAPDAADPNVIVRSNRSFWTAPKVAGLVALAAAVVLSLSAVVLLQRDSTAGMPAAAVRFASREHNRCSNNPAYSDRKFMVEAVGEVPELFAGLAGRPVGIADLASASASGLMFVEAGPCAVPAPGRPASIHVRFALDEDPAAQISLFAVETEAWPVVTGAATYRISRDARDAAEVTYVWRSSGVVYFLVADDAEAAETAREALSTPGDAPETIQL
ncbi:MAG: hypothetical protein AAFY58_00135 [Planctomycetota bacterium]